MATSGAEEVPPALRREHLDPGVGGRERQDHAAERDGQEERAGAGRPRGRSPTSRAGRPGAAARSSSARGTARAATTATRPERGGPARRTDDRDEQLAPGDVGEQRCSAPRRPGRRPPQRDREESRGPPSRRCREPTVASGGSRDSSRRGPADEDGEDEPDDEVDREDHPPVGDGEDHRAVERADDAADLLDGRDDPERYAAPLDRVEVGDQGQRGRDQPATADPLQEPADHQRGAGRRRAAVTSEPIANTHQRARPAPAPGRAGRRSGRSAAASRRSRAGSRTRSAPRAGARRSGCRPTPSCRAGRARRRRCRRPRTPPRRRRAPAASRGPAVTRVGPCRGRRRRHGAVMSLLVP